MAGRKNILAEIEKLETFSDTIERIDELNVLIVEKIDHISKNYKMDRSIFGDCDRELIKQGIDVVWTDVAYMPILEKFMEKGSNENKKEYLNQYLEFQDLIYERIMIGKKVIEHKHPRDLAITRPFREFKVYRKVGRMAKERGLHVRSMLETFRDTMNINKQLQKCIAEQNPLYALEDDQFYVQRSMTTQCEHILNFRDPADAYRDPKDPKNKLKEPRDLDPANDKFTLCDMVDVAKGLEKKYPEGGKHFVRSKVEGNKYVVEVVSEKPYKVA